jgi:hypothetical protein
MNKKALLILPLVVCLSACATVSSSTATTCKHVTPSPSCSGDKNFPSVTINTQVDLVVDRNNACAAPGSTIEFRVVPPGKNEIASVTIRSKDPAHTWLNGTNSPDKKKIEILVPDWVEVDQHYDYAIYTSSGTCMDPRVEVKN